MATKTPTASAAPTPAPKTPMEPNPGKGGLYKLVDGKRVLQERTLSVEEAADQAKKAKA